MVRQALFVLLFFCLWSGGCAGGGSAVRDARLDESFPAARAPSVGLDQDALDGLVELAKGFVDEDRIVGAEVLIIKDRKTVLHEAVGWSDREGGVAMECGSVYRIRSMTKPFTGTAAMMLIDDGRLRLDSRPAEFFPSWDNERSRDITVEQLLAHQSGFEQGGWPATKAGYGSLWEMVDACGELGPTGTPGEKFIYSDVNSFTLGGIVAQMSGKPLEDFIERRILEPVGIVDIYTGYTTDAPWAGRMNPTYWRTEDDTAWESYWSPDQAQELGYFRASGGLYATTTAYARWLACWMDGTRLAGGERLLSAELADAALRAHGSDEDGAYGYHWEVYPDGTYAFGHSGSDGTFAVAVRSLDLIALYFTQSRGHDTREEWRAALWDAVGADDARD